MTADWLWRLSALYVLVTIVWGIGCLWLGRGDGKSACGYGELVNIRPFLILLVAWTAASGAAWLYRHWMRLVLVPASWRYCRWTIAAVCIAV